MKNPILIVLSLLVIFSSCDGPIVLDAEGWDFSGLSQWENCFFEYTINSDTLTREEVFKTTKARTEGHHLDITMRSDSSEIHLTLKDFDGLGFYPNTEIAMDYETEVDPKVGLCGTANVAIKEFSADEFVSGEFTGLVYFEDCDGTADLLIKEGRFYLKHKSQ